MSIHIRQFSCESAELEAFQKLPQRLYSPERLTQNRREERDILLGIHPLSHYFHVYKFLAYVDGVAVARAVLTQYNGTKEGYFGFFEAENHPKAVAALFGFMKRFARTLGLQRLSGPVNASFWIGYRLKIDHFDRPYSGEPYNLPYYKDLLETAGFRTIQTYCSNRFGVIPQTYENAAYEQRLNEKRRSGYEIHNLKKTRMESSIREIYRLLIRRYRDFPAFHWISEEEFARLYGPLKYIADGKMVKLAYYQGQLVGFFISIPNYHNLISGGLVKALPKLLSIKRSPKAYVMLYLGVDEAHRGLGKALSHSIMMELRRSGATSIGALILEGKANASYYADLIEYQYHYILMETEI